MSETFKKQREHILDNLKELVETTNLDSNTVKFFLQKRILSRADETELNDLQNPDKNLKFYETIIYHSQFYEVLTESIRKSHQSNVLAILEKLQLGQTEPTGSVPQTMHNLSNNLIVGGKGCSVAQVTAILTKSQFMDLFDRYWTQVSRALDTPHHEITRIHQKLLLNMLTLNDAICHIVELWVGRKGRNATLQSLITALGDNGMKSCGDTLEDAFFSIVNTSNSKSIQLQE